MTSAKETILILGSGGREHALAWRAAHEGYAAVVAPGNPGMREVAAIEAVNLTNHLDVIEVARRVNAALIVIGPEDPLVDGLSDALRAAGFLVFGPSQAAAQLEGSKAHAKAFMARWKIPTAAYVEVANLGDGLAALTKFAEPPVVKASGLAAGKGVVVANTLAEAEQALRECLVDERFGKAGQTVVLEERLVGEEASFFAICDGTRAVYLAPCQDHKRVFDGDLGPNTGGMGAYCPAPVCTAQVQARVIKEIVEPTLAGLSAENRPFVGVLFVGLMIDPQGAPRVIEYNVRFGDPEIQPLMFGLRSRFFPVLFAAARGKLEEAELLYDPAATIVLASQGYPTSSTKGSPISGLDRANGLPGVHVFHAGTAMSADGTFVSNGGRVLGVCGRGSSLREAVDAAYSAIAAISMPGGHFRRDIASRAFARSQDG
jgi:phosphoribosylamine--glycine ligase